MIEYTTRFDKTYVDLQSLVRELYNVRFNLLDADRKALHDLDFETADAYFAASRVVLNLIDLLSSQAPFIIAESLV